jgi:anion-transporting  ArsA/GET3 family ATPase
MLNVLLDRECCVCEVMQALDISQTRASRKLGRIDAEGQTRAYREEVMSAVGDKLDEQGRALLAEDLRSPCTEEVAVSRTFARTVAEGQDGFVVLDTAPTGHTILLLDAAEAYHREVLRQSSNMPETVREHAARGHPGPRGSAAAERPGPR